MRSFFFIPAGNKKILSKASAIPASDIVIDLEDALGNTPIADAIQNLKDYSITDNWWARIPSSIRKEHLKELHTIGFSKYLLAKIESRDQIDGFISNSTNIAVKNLSLLVLCESPLAIVNLREIASHPEVEGLGFGSHDYCQAVGMRHNLENVNWARQSVLNYSKAFQKFVIDIASMNIDDKNAFAAECVDGKDKGFDGKFLIHPWQLDLFLQHWKFNDADLQFALKVKEYMDEIGGVQNFSVANIDGKVVELPHLDRIDLILKSSNYGGL
ncbi:aldolase/citrate lyase family protein [uncultured Algoriphagus sp.]|uniref:HpcH/HpaI aldolase/citrate lyase family protein n=1 Tax=uncultured Algoriphagus sp. TaxID=417365 RepID=UPI00258BC072|nr:aldolase/citrate lyase family protein [uncultured Algoriphagus sp.]